MLHFVALNKSNTAILKFKLSLCIKHLISIYVISNYMYNLINRCLNSVEPPPAHKQVKVLCHNNTFFTVI